MKNNIDPMSQAVTCRDYVRYEEINTETLTELVVGMFKKNCVEKYKIPVSVIRERCYHFCNTNEYANCAKIDKFVSEMIESVGE